MVGTISNMSLAEASVLCPALLSLIKPVPSIDFGSLTSTATTRPVLINVFELLRRPECAHNISSYVDSKGHAIPNSPLDVLLNNSGNGLAVSHSRIYESGTAQTIPAYLLSPVEGKQTRSTQHSSMLTTVVAKAEDEYEYWPTHIRLLMSLVFIVLSVVGIVGNILVVVVVRKVPAPTELSYLHVASSKYIFGEFGCLMFSYLPYLAINTSSMSITAFTVERFIGICYPLRARYICTVKRAKMIIFFIWVFCIFYNSPWLYLATLKEDTAHGQQCTFKLTRDNWTYKVMFLGDFSAFYLIPMILYVFIYGKITYTLSRCGLKCSKKLISQSDSLPTTTRSTNKATPLHSTANQKHREYFVSNGNRKSSTKAKVQVMWNSFASSSKWDPDCYNLMSGRFRSAFKRLFVDRVKSNGFKRDSLNSPPAVLSSNRNRNKRNGTTDFGKKSATAKATILTIAGEDEDSPRTLSKSCSLVPQNNYQSPFR